VTSQWAARITEPISVIGCGVAGSRLACSLLDLGVRPALISGFDVEDATPHWPLSLAPVRKAWDEASPRKIAIVATPAHERRAIVSELIDLGVKALFVEKPITDTSGPLGWCHDVAGRLDWYRVISQVGYCWRFHPAVMAARSWVAGRRADGLVAEFTCLADMPSWGRAETYRDPWGELSHELDTAFHLFGPGAPKRIPTPRTEDGKLYIEHASGAKSFVTLNATAGTYRREITVVDRRASAAYIWVADDFTGGVEGDWIPEDMYRLEMAEFLRAVATGTTSACTWQEALQVAEWAAVLHGWGRA